MARQIIDTTTDHGTYKGDPAKVAFEKANANDAELYDATAKVASYSGKNLLINCGVPINQRGFGGGALAAGIYGYDRWKGGSGGCNVAINAGTGVFTHTSGPLVQVIAAPAAAWGRPLTFSVEDPSGPISVNVGGATGTIPAGAGRRSITVTPSGSGNMTVQITATGATYSRPQLERGAAATEFDYQDESEERVRCQRFYEIVGFIAVANGPDFTSIYYKVSKRAVPAVSMVSGTISPATLSARGNLGYVSMDGRAASAAAVSIAVDAEL